MKLIVFSLIVSAVVAEKLQANYLPPLGAKSAGGANFLLAPITPKYPAASAFESRFTKSGIATSYAAPPSGPVPSGLYNAPSETYSAGYSGSYSSGTPIAILKFNNKINEDGSYRFEYGTENKISQQEEGHLENIGSNDESSVVHGSYSYQAPEGQTIAVNYVADKYGFRASGDHLPIPPSVPLAIQKSLEVNAAASRSGFSRSSTFETSGFGIPDQNQISRQYLAPRTKTETGYKY